MDSPAKIAQYLLKGYCLLNEYCPNGSSIPLLRHPNGTYVCVCGDASCKYSDSPSTQTVSHTGQKPSGASESGYPTARPSAEPMRAEVPRPVPPTTSCPSTERQAGLPPPSNRSVEVAVRGPELSFTCSRVVKDQLTGRLRLLGGAYSVQARASVPIGSTGHGSETACLRQALRLETRAIADHVLIPQGCHGLLLNQTSESVRATMEGRSFELPTDECILLATGDVSIEDMSAYLWERVVQCTATSAWRALPSSWLEVSVADHAGAEASYRSPWPQTKSS
mmetsp:Transcript_41682/g.75692  ORF Transcript_41682/g.75692 Transcript_41682/m.75692 type:complete len:280 (-) Transcript_41682:59-898(-)